MSGMIDCRYLNRMYSPLPENCTVRSTAARTSSFLDMAAKASRGTADVLEISSRPEVTNEGETSNVDAYKKHLENKYGQVTIQSVGKDQASLQKAGGRMNGNSVVIAPNILEDMANDPEKAAYYEQKIDDFFNATPRLKAQFAAQGLNYEPCGGVIHEDGSVTYIGGCGDSPERVAEVNRINAEKAKKKAEQQRQYQEQAAVAAAQRRAMWERTAAAEALEKSFSNIGDLLKTRMVSAPAVMPEISLPAGANMFSSICNVRKGDTMSNTIQPSYGAQTYSTPTKAREAKQTGTQGSSFMDMAARASERKHDVFEVNRTEAVQQKAELSEAEEMQLFKKEFYADLSKIVCNPTVSNAAVNISDAAFQAMKDDPEYRAQVLSLLQRDLGASFAPRNCSILITVGTDLNQYRADSWPVSNDSEFHSRSKGSFWEQRMERHKKYMELAEEAAAKRRLMMKLRMNGGSVSAAELLMGLL